MLIPDSFSVTGSISLAVSSSKASTSTFLLAETFTVPVEPTSRRAFSSPSAFILRVPNCCPLTEINNVPFFALPVMFREPLSHSRKIENSWSLLIGISPFVETNVPTIIGWFINCCAIHITGIPFSPTFLGKAIFWRASFEMKHS